MIDATRVMRLLNYSTGCNLTLLVECPACSAQGLDSNVRHCSPMFTTARYLVLPDDQYPILLGRHSNRGASRAR